MHCASNTTDFHKAASEGVNLLIRLMYSDVRPLCADLFEKSWWRSRKCVKGIVATLKDYFENVFQDYLHDDFFQLLLSRSLRSLEIEYLRCVGCERRTAQPQTSISHGLFPHVWHAQVSVPEASQDEERRRPRELFAVYGL